MLDHTKFIDNYFDSLIKTIENIDRKEISTLINLLINARNNGKQIFIMGNGGSASTASHFVCDFNKGASYGMQNRFKVICLNDSMSTLSAYANDVGYETIFVEQLKNFLNPGDLVIGISGSGNSRNILLAIEYANSIKATTIGITGYDGGKLKKISNFSVNANINDMQISEDIHAIINHVCMKSISNNCSC